ncbi:hypothetical protein N0V90_008927 [Kalmusia sp. IMI 367209]|nr:hypothetical protein N0V90_008927 [Kalmusia sp. IMI 367209]
MSQLGRSTSASAPATPRTPSSAPSTPAAQKAHEGTPGSWKHPKFDEITRRQYATTFDERNVKMIVANGGLLFVTFTAPSVLSRIALLRTLSGWISSLFGTWAQTRWWAVLILRLWFLFNIIRALWPLARRYYPDDIADIPLTPSQRQAMGLKVGVSTPQTPGSAYASPNYVTPPRYQKSTPRSSFSNQIDRSSQSPLSGSPRASMTKSTSNSPFSPSTGSPLFQKAVNGGSTTTKRMSFGGSTPSSSFFGESSSSATPSTPTPSTGKASVGLNNKWLYEKRRDSPRSSLFN